MTPIESAGRTQIALLNAAGPESSFDPTAVLLALSAQQMNFFQSAIASQVGMGRESLTRIASASAASLETVKLRDTVIAAESSSVAGVAEQIRSFGESYQGGESSSLSLNAADNERMRQWEVWAAERGMVLADSTRTIYPSEAEIAAAKEAKVTPPEPREVVDAAAVRQNLAALETYLSGVQSGTADNGAIRGLLASTTGGKLLAANIRELGYSGPLDTLANWATASTELERMVNVAVRELTTSAELLKKLTEQLSAKGAELQQFVRATTDQTTVAAEKEQLEAQLRMQELSRLLGEVVREQLQAIQEAELATHLNSLPKDAVEKLVGKLDEAGQMQLSKDFAAWKADFLAGASRAVEFKPTHNPLAAMRRDYM